MGNTKMFYFDGEVKGENLPIFRDEVELKCRLYANYLVLQVHPGEYLNPDASGYFVIGALESSSQFDPVGPLARWFESGTIVEANLAWTDVTVFDVSLGKASVTAMYCLSLGIGSDSNYPNVQRDDEEKRVLLVLPPGWTCSVMAVDSGCEAKANPYRHLADHDYPCGVDVKVERREPAPAIEPEKT